MYQTSSKFSLSNISQFLTHNSGMFTYAILAVALGGFEIFNYSTTQVALNDLLGPISFAGMQWATILAIAFCGIDFAGIARLFTGDSIEAANEVRYLFGAWLLAATMNAILTWWGVSMALQGHQIQSASIIDKKLMMAVPIFVAVMVWVTRVLLIGSFSMAGRKTQSRDHGSHYNRPITNNRPMQQIPRVSAQSTSTTYDRAQSPLSGGIRPQPLATSSPLRSTIPARPEPEYVSDGEPTSATAALRPTTTNQERHF
jgi:hypothetical protein